MFFFSLLLPVLALLYGGLILLYRLGWERTEPPQQKTGYLPSFSIIIPARNEEQNIAACLEAILEQHYPADRFEILVIDDHSEDRTAEIVSGFADRNVRCSPLRDFIGAEAVIAYKKKALSAGIAQSSGEIIVTTDADCVAGPDWLGALAAGFSNAETVLLAAPVDFTSDGSLVQRFQSLDFMTMQGITAAAQTLGLGGMANGANLAFRRSAYEAVGGYVGTEHLASGDDYLLLAKIRAHFPGRTAYLKKAEAIVLTAPQPDWRGFFRQRIRWASKSGKYKDTRLTVILALVYLFNVTLLAATIALLFLPRYWMTVASVWVWKVGLELLFLHSVAGFFKRRSELWTFPLLQPLHVTYIFLAGFLGMVGKFEWKGRTVR